ncbi:MAG: hypothetical protein KKA05_10310, partial [Alphaproteobacteria bacterium]|nr:hypothetical protein [Alphaproteobacteria bacterium]
MTGAAKPFTVIAYVDGDYGVRTYTARVMARPGDAWPSAVRHWAQEIERTEGPRAAFRFVEAVTEVETFHGHPRSEGER